MANSLDQIKAKLKAPERPYTEFPAQDHGILGKVYIGKLSTRGYCELEAFTQPTPDVAKWPQAAIVRWVQEGQMRVLFKYCVHLEDGSRLDDETINLLINGNYGEENQKLVDACRRENPPREYMAEEVFTMLQFNAWALTMLEAAQRAGLWQHVITYLSGQADDPEVKAAAEVLAGLEDALPVFKAMFRIEEAEKADQLKKVSDESANKTAEAIGETLSNGLS